MHPRLRREPPSSALRRHPVIACGPPGLLVGGTADEGAWDSSAARATGLTVLELAGLDHSLEDPADWRRGPEAMLTVGAAVEDFARGL